MGTDGEVVLLEKSLLTTEGLHFTDFAFGPIISPRGDCVEIYKGYIFVAWYRGGMDDRHVMLSRSKIGSNKWEHIEVNIQLAMLQSLIAEKVLTVHELF